MKTLTTKNTHADIIAKLERLPMNSRVVARETSRCYGEWELTIRVEKMSFLDRIRNPGSTAWVMVAGPGVAVRHAASYDEGYLDVGAAYEHHEFDAVIDICVEEVTTLLKR